MIKRKSKIIKIPERLRRFLAERDALAPFERNMRRYSGGCGNPANIESAFDWCATPEGFDYWNNLAIEYDRYIIADVLTRRFYGDDDGRAD